MGDNAHGRLQMNDLDRLDKWITRIAIILGLIMLILFLASLFFVHGGAQRA